MHHPLSPLWKLPLRYSKSRLQHGVDSAMEQVPQLLPVRVYFRADDIGIPGKRFSRLLDLFLDYRMPLCLAVVPAWLSRQRWEAFQKADQQAPQNWCWHQHGWRHLSHEIAGKKQEFGPVRTAGDIVQDITRGRKKLEHLMKDRFMPVFTPPWNRCDGRTLALLKKNGFKAVSRHHHSVPEAPEGLPDFAVNVDLHTRRETQPEEGCHALMEELSAAISSGTCGIMIHHQRMNPAAFDFLELLLCAMKQNPRILPVHFKDMLHE
ncbi:MAG: DUF2334 domain-containing protein [Deltaproteobacteria bacterium]|nr:DUF2334 domain-containing protein [Deltaproteobacteria bacterium]